MDFLSKTVIILLTLFFTANAFALPITGGTVTMENDWTVPYTMTDNSDGTVYQSFCLESKNYFTPGVTYTVASVGDYAVGGGVGPAGDLVSGDTKWLYAAFISNVFQNVTDAALRVQEAIWFLEAEAGGIEGSWSNLKNNYSFNDSGWTVVAVNLTLNGIDNQSQLVGTASAPVPEPATMLLLGTGLVGLAGIRRKKMNK